MKHPEWVAQATMDNRSTPFLYRLSSPYLKTFRLSPDGPAGAACHPLAFPGLRPLPRVVPILKGFCRQAAVWSLAFCQMFFLQVQATTLAPAQMRTQYDPAIEQVAQKNGVDANLLRAIITVESGFRPAAYNGGAVGLMQVKPSTAHHFGIDNVHDPVKNIEAGGRYLRHLLDMFDNNIRLAIAAYNAGEGTILRRNHRMPAMTHTYVTKVLAFWHSYQRLY